MGCVFCATAKLGFLHDLRCGEIVEQVLWAERELRDMEDELGASFPRQLAGGRSRPGHRLTNLVFMGMGEAFNNYDNWWSAVERLHDEHGYNLGARNFTVSTVGLVPGIRRLAGERLPVNLAISLHAPDDVLRTELMPVNKSYPIASVMEATREYVKATNRRVSFEYVLLQEKNDTPEHAAALAEWLTGRRDGGAPLLCHVNLIPWNPVPGAPLGRSHRRRVLAFQDVLQKQGVPCTVRVERGTEIGAACGQLAGRERE
jgi:23S rRNA (adenine2503-C2)-methyltransferase